MCQLLPCILIGVEVFGHLEFSRNTPETGIKKLTKFSHLSFVLQSPKDLNSSLPLGQIVLNFVALDNS